MGVTEIARALGIDKAKAYRLLLTLKEKGYVQKDEIGRKYSLSLKLFEIGNSIVANMGLKRTAYPFLKELANTTKEAVNLAIRDGNAIIYIDKIDSTSTIRVDLRLGRRMPLYCTALGKSLLSGLTDTEIGELLQNEKFECHTKNTIRNLPLLIEEIKKVRSCGYSIDNEEYVDGLFCVAAPVMGYSGKIVAAISVALPCFTHREDEKIKKIKKIIQNVLKVTNLFSRQLSMGSNV